MTEVARVVKHAHQRLDETLREACVRVATDAVYAARNDGGTMHDAGAAAADAVMAIYAALDRENV